MTVKPMSRHVIAAPVRMEAPAPMMLPHTRTRVHVIPPTVATPVRLTYHLATVTPVTTEVHAIWTAPHLPVCAPRNMAGMSVSHVSTHCDIFYSEP